MHLIGENVHAQTVEIRPITDEWIQITIGCTGDMMRMVI